MFAELFKNIFFTPKDSIDTRTTSVSEPEPQALQTLPTPSVYKKRKAEANEAEDSPKAKSPKASPLQTTPTPISSKQAPKIDEKPLKSDHFKTLASEYLAPKRTSLTKEKIIEKLEEAFHVKISYKILTDIHSDDLQTQIKIIGRPDTHQGRKQMRHVIPFSFLKQLIAGSIEDSKNPNETLHQLIPPALALTKMQDGFALTSQELETDEYESIRERCVKQHNRSIQQQDATTFLFSPERGDKIFSTTRKKAKAAEKFFSPHAQYAKEALEALIEETEQDPNVTIITSELLTRLMFTVFNSSKNTSFAKEGNTSNTEIRLYKSAKAAFEKPLEEYEVMTAREIETLLKSKTLNKCIRLVNCEGSKVREINKALKAINAICSEEGDTEQLIDTYNQKYNYQLKLANTNIGKSYNNPMKYHRVEKEHPFHVAKLLYSAFDLTALENKVLAPEQKSNQAKSITILASAQGKRTVKYQITKGDKAREDAKNSAIDYSSEEVFRTKETDRKILPEKLAELFVIGTMAINHINIIESLKKLIKLAATDHKIQTPQQLKFEEETISAYEALTEHEITTAVSLDQKFTKEAAEMTILGSPSSSDITTEESDAMSDY